MQTHDVLTANHLKKQSMFEPSVIVSLMNGVTPSSNVVNRTDAMLSRNVNRDSEYQFAAMNADIKFPLGSNRAIRPWDAL